MRRPRLAPPCSRFAGGAGASAIGRFAGLALASWVSSSYFAMHAKRTMVLHATVGKLGSGFGVRRLLQVAPS